MLARSLVVLTLSLALAPTLAAQTSPLVASRFTIVVDGIEIASFTKLELIASEVRGLQEFSNDTTGRGVVTFSQPQSDNLQLWAWHEAVLHGDIITARRSARVIAYNRAGAEVARYQLTNAWPAKIAVGTLRTGSTEVLTETITLVCEKIERVGS